MSGQLYDLALSVPWLITPEALAAMLSIAERDPLPADEIARRMHGPQSLALRDGSRRDDSARMTVRDGVALIPIDGPIYRYADMFTSVSGGVTTEALAKDFQRALDDPAVRAVLFVIDSPGGESTGINELADAIYAARGQKPIAAYIEGYGASAAYWIASACGEIYADDHALIGSIGVVLGVPDPTKRARPTIEFVSTQSPKKRADPTSEAGRAYLQQLVDDMSAVFIAKVARNRAVSEQTVLDDFGQGGLLVGQAAVDAGLADRIGSEEAAIRDLAARAQETGSGLAGVRRRAQEGAMNDGRGFWAAVFGGARDAGIAPPSDDGGASDAPLAALPPGAEAAQRELLHLRAELAKAQADRVGAAAEAFVRAQLSAGRALPAEQAALLALYARLAEMDAAHPRADGQPSCIALLSAAYAARPASLLTTDLIAAPPLARYTLAAEGDADTGGIDAAKSSARAYAERANGRRTA